MLVMISMPMDGELSSTVKLKMEKLTNQFKKLHIDVLDTYFEEDPPEYYNNKGLYYMARSIEAMAKCDAVYFAKGWQNSKGCRMEREIAKAYTMKILDEDFFETKEEEHVKWYADNKPIEKFIGKGMDSETYNVMLCQQRNQREEEIDKHIPHID